MIWRSAGLVFALAFVQPPSARDAYVEPATGMRFVRIPPGSFLMGSPRSEPMRQPDEAPHRVTLSHGFLLGRFEVTQREWRLVMETSPSRFAGCDRCPVERVSYPEIEEFLRRLGERSDGRMRFRLPTEAEWEYACRAGLDTPFAAGPLLRAGDANYDTRFPYASAVPEPDARRGRTVEVGSYAPNAWGLHDMHGNVWEWTSDWYAPYSAGGAVDPSGPGTGDRRVIRGGSWRFDANSARCALRYTHRPQDRGDSLGFRVVAERRVSADPLERGAEGLAVPRSITLRRRSRTD